MSELSSEQKERYLDEADKHANFLCDKVFKPAFVMAFIHGIKHGRVDMANELGDNKRDKELERLRMDLLKIDNYCRVNGIDIEAALR